MAASGQLEKISDVASLTGTAGLRQQLLLSVHPDAAGRGLARAGFPEYRDRLAGVQHCDSEVVEIGRAHV